MPPPAADAAPRAAPRTPAFRMPPGACDTHCHLFGPALVPSSAFKKPPIATARELREVHAAIGVERVVIVQGQNDAADFQAMRDAIRAAGETYRGVALLDDAVTDAALETLDAEGIKGIRFTFVEHLGGVPDMAMVARMVARIQPLGWHLVLLFAPGDIVVYEDFLRALPLPYVIDHFGRVEPAGGLAQKPFALLLDLLGGGDCWVKVSAAERLSPGGPPYAEMVPFARQIMATAPDRVLWGTDWPHPNFTPPPDEGDLVDLIPLYTDHDAGLQHKLLVANPARLYGFAESRDRPPPPPELEKS